MGLVIAYSFGRRCLPAQFLSLLLPRVWLLDYLCLHYRPMKCSESWVPGSAVRFLLITPAVFFFHAKLWLNLTKRYACNEIRRHHLPRVQLRP